MKISILTASYNQGEFIEENILSVLHQSDVIVEHIIIDGGSVDSTIDVLKKYPHLVWVSEKDEGQADALQKGLQKATGDIIGWINSDDYLDTNILRNVEMFFQNPNTNWIIGNLTVVRESNSRLIPDKSRRITKKNLFSNPDILRQPCAFFRKESLIKAGGFTKKYHLTMDIDLWFRLLKESEPLMIDKNFAFFRVHKNQKTSDMNMIIPQMKELVEIFKKNDAPLFFITKLVCKKIYMNQKMKLVSFYHALKSI